MATQKIKAVIPRIIENRGNVSKSMLEVGYRPATARNPKNLTETKGFKDAMAELGLTENLIATALVEDIKAKPKRRFLEMSLGAEILGMKHRPKDEEGDKTPNLTIINLLIPNGPSGN